MIKADINMTNRKASNCKRDLPFIMYPIKVFLIDIDCFHC